MSFPMYYEGISSAYAMEHFRDGQVKDLKKKKKKRFHPICILLTIDIIITEIELYKFLKLVEYPRLQSCIT